MEVLFIDILRYLKISATDKATQVFLAKSMSCQAPIAEGVAFETKYII